MPNTLLEETCALLKKDPRRLSDLARATKLPYHWLRNVKLGKVKNPGVNRVEALKKFLC